MAAINSNTSSKYEDIIRKSVWIHPGPPAVYQLTTKMETIGNERRVTFGEKNVNKLNKTILLVGETGAGKSTLINALVSYTIGVKWDDEVWFQIVENEKSEYESQTSDVIVYKIFGFEDKTLPYSLTIIDTPGYGNTRGIKHDDMISKKLLDLFQSEDGVHEVHAVGLVMKATDNRMNDRPIYVFDSVMSLFGRDLENKIVALITHSNGRRPKRALEALEAAKIKCAKNKKNQPVHFLFDNCQHEERTEEKDYLQHADTLSERGISDFTDFLKESEPQKLEITVKVLNEQIRLADCIKNLHKRTEQAQLKEEEIRQNKEALKKHEEEIKENEEFTVEAVEVKIEKEKNGWWSFFNQPVCCTVCETTCSYSYNKPERCKVIKDGHCTQCPNKCPVSVHVQENWKYVTKTKKVKKTDEEMKEKYEKNKSESQKKLSLLEKLEKEMNQLTAEKSKFLDESYQHVIRLEQIALKADSASTIVHLDFLIEKMTEKGDTEKVQKLEEMRSRADEGTKAALQFKQHLRK